MIPAHVCPVCGLVHWPPTPREDCVCGHPRFNHDLSTRARRKPCTVGSPEPCPCQDYNSAPTGATVVGASADPAPTTATPLGEPL